MTRSSGRSAADRWRRRRRLALAGAALGAPAVAHALIQHRLRPPEAPGWGRTHRFAGHLGPIVYQELGAGEPIVLLHAFGPGFDARQWQAAAEALAPHCRVLAPDLPGWGRSAPLEPNPETCLASLADFLAGVVWTRAVLVAAGHAAPYAVHLAAEHPDLVRGIALVAPRGLHCRGAAVTGAMDGGDRINTLDNALDDPKLPDELLDDLDDPEGQDAGDELDEVAELDRQDREDGLDELARQDEMDEPDADLPSHPLVADLLRVPILRISVLDALTSRAALSGYLRSYAYAAPERVDAALIEHHYRVSHLPAHRRTLAAYWRGELALPAAATLCQLQVPAWVILGGGGGPERLAADSLPPGSEIETIAGTRALPHAEKPLAVGEALARFLASLPAS